MGVIQGSLPGFIVGQPNGKSITVWVQNLNGHSRCVAFGLSNLLRGLKDSVSFCFPIYRIRIVISVLATGWSCEHQMRHREVAEKLLYECTMKLIFYNDQLYLLNCHFDCLKQRPKLTVPWKRWNFRSLSWNSVMCIVIRGSVLFYLVVLPSVDFCSHSQGPRWFITLSKFQQVVGMRQKGWKRISFLFKSHTSLPFMFSYTIQSAKPGGHPAPPAPPAAWKAENCGLPSGSHLPSWKL